MILMNDGRINNSQIKKSGSLYMSILFMLNQEKGLKLNPSKIDIYYTQLQSKGIITNDGYISISELLEFFNIEASKKDESVTYKLKKNERSIVSYESESGEPFYVVGVNNIVCYNPLGNILKGKPSEVIVFKFK